MTGWLVLVAVIWILIGVATALAMGRRGHSPWGWGLLGAVLGPLVLPFVMLGLHDESIPEPVRVVHRGTTAATGISVLVGVDGSPQSHAATEAVVALFGPRLRSLTLATVVDFDTAQRIEDGADPESERAARAVLDGAACDSPSVRPTTVVLRGRPAPALASYAHEHGIDLIAVGRRGRGLSEALLGSVAEELVGMPNVVVLISGQAATTSTAGAEAPHVKVSSAPEL
jgi:nucleotide-binding universal stress UspA family protein